MWAFEIKSFCWVMRVWVYHNFHFYFVWMTTTHCAMRWCVTYKNEIFTGVKGLEEDMWKNFISKEECEDLFAGYGMIYKILKMSIYPKYKIILLKTFFSIFCTLKLSLLWHFHSSTVSLSLTQLISRKKGKISVNAALILITHTHHTSIPHPKRKSQ